jgi:hypothetical protein
MVESGTVTHWSSDSDVSLVATPDLQQSFLARRFFIWIQFDETYKLVNLLTSK